jgi:hypothetical protein
MLEQNGIKHLDVDLHLKLTHPEWFILRGWAVDKSVGLNSL